MSKIGELKEKLLEKDKYFIQMSEILLDRIDFYEDIESDKNNWVNELQKENVELRDKIGRAITYLEAGKTFTNKDVEEEIKYMQDTLLSILKGGNSNE